MQDIPLNLRPIYPKYQHYTDFDCLKLKHTHALRTQLIGEMIELDRQRCHHEEGASQIDLSLLQTYKEMINSRRVLVDKISAGLIH